ncbi:PREDICTED: pentatricopeptide repeat-containing protein At5g42450, mitochondrial-like [Nelumbo nucifera]|uniref:Pentatricopeptide repeat-containing protein At5g42450, mitochondrial-like n=2 Tax=Nelumbo nucifera TaxID=4432 RepID=A0A1U8A1I9_NELNU|nr:PREDICTED: pentatricopeptide repeat-containing protein At5g42450, mitochondrial-like [Nelumbo nucifera]DAD27833.1 TPA_asm: hypothetical protein HUJ06_029301 [Nelumbo nucifera]
MCLARPSNILPFIRKLHRQRVHNLALIHIAAEAQQAHARLLKLGTSNLVESGLVATYCESKAFSYARQLFDETYQWDLISATSIIGSFARHNRHKEAIDIFSRMLVLNIRPNGFTFGTVIHSSTVTGNIATAKQLHACATKVGLHSDVFVGSSLLDSYAKLTTIEEVQRAFQDIDNPNVVSYTTLISAYLKHENFEDALRYFREMPDRNVVSWNAVIGGYSQMGHSEEAVNLFVEMIREGLSPNESTFPCVLSAAANIAALGMGKSFHACAIKSLGKHDVFVGNSLINFYAKCGSMEDSLLAFDRLAQRSIISWNSLICGYAQNGRGKEAIDCFRRMKASGFKPNSVTLLCLLLACNHAGLVDEGYSYFNLVRMEDPSLLRPEHYACVVDLLSRSGRFRQAERFLEELPFDPGVGFWKALLGGCQTHSNTELAELAARKILALDPKDVSSYVMLSNAHSAAGRWESVSMIRREMREKRMKRVPGSSWIEIKNKIHIFVNGDKRHIQSDEIYTVVTSCIQHLKDITSACSVAGY